MDFNPGIDRDQAVVALVIEEAGNKLQSLQQGYLGRTTLQKILYFLQVSGVPLQYRFDVHHFGPFCPDVLHDVEWLTELGIVGDTSQNPQKYSNYRITSEGKKHLVESEVAKSAESHKETIRTIVGALLPLEVDELELIATLHYAYREVRASASETPKRSVIINRFKVFKGDKFEEQRIESACDRMARAHLMEFV